MKHNNEGHILTESLDSFSCRGLYTMHVGIHRQGWGGGLLVRGSIRGGEVNHLVVLESSSLEQPWQRSYCLLSM